MKIPSREERMIRVRSAEKRFAKYCRVQVWYDTFKRRYEIRRNGSRIWTLSFSEQEWNTRQPENGILGWMHGQSAPKRSVDMDYEDQRKDEKEADELNEKFSYACEEFMKYGYSGSQAPGSQSVVVDGFKNA